MLRTLGRDGIYAAKYQIQEFGLKYASQMTVMRLSDNSLVLHSPCQLTSELREELDRLDAPVSHVLFPNKYMGCLHRVLIW
jgi:hypothetical protein